MKENKRTIILGILAVCSTYVYFLSAAPIAPDAIIKEIPRIDTITEETKALNYLNYLRHGAGLIPFSNQNQLKLAAQNHANYLTLHSLYGHEESTKHKDFTGEFASNRITHTGYSSPQVIENVSTLNQNYKESVDGLFAAIYHRLAFLDIRSDSIGIGISQNHKNRAQTAFVYDMSSSQLEKLYASKERVTNKNLTKALEDNKYINAKVVIYPFNKQKDVPPAFFDELPDPLPEHLVSGFPISISFNSFFYKEAKLLSFKLFNANGKELTNVLVFDKESDPNQRLASLDFVLFPLERLAWNQKYYVKFSAMVDGKRVEKNWNFKTKKFKEPFHIVTQNDEKFTIALHRDNIFYFPPTSKVDILHDVGYPENFDIAFIDKNTIRLKALSRANEPQRLNIAEHYLWIEIQ